MPSRQPLAEGLHNHPPRCCCESRPGGAMVHTCPACPEHGDLAECPSCHTHAGHPHTDYCTAVAPADYPGQPDHCTYDPELPGMWEAADLAGGQADTETEHTADQGWCHECGRPQHP